MHSLRLASLRADSTKSVQRCLLSGMYVLAFLAFGLLFASEAHAANSAETFVQSTINKSYAILNDGALNASERQQRFHALLVSAVDARRVALFTLGPYARDAAQVDVETFKGAFTDFLTAVYQRGLDKYVGPKVTGSSERARGDVIVNVIAASPNGSASRLELAFRVRQTSNGENVITDLQVEGAWLALTQRAEFTAYLQQHGTNIAGLAMELEKRTAQIRLAQSETEIYRRER
jgi:phospholipid transport system substrate-binding protein